MPINARFFGIVFNKYLKYGKCVYVIYIKEKKVFLHVLSYVLRVCMYVCMRICV